MSINNLSPYIHFNGCAEQAIEFYKSALGATVIAKMRYSEAPGMPAPAGCENLIMHAHLQLGGGSIMLSDSRPDLAKPLDGSVQVCLDYADAESMTAAFDAITANGGKVILAIHDTFWGAKFGIANDSFGVRWLFNHTVAK